jgi:Domain of unknown function (DUF4258)
MSSAPGIWKPAEATKRINACARGIGLTLTFSEHFHERLQERGLIMGDLLYVLKTGFVYDEGEESTRPGHFKYRIEGTSPNSDRRMIRAVVIPDGDCAIKVVTIMWKDEK